ncbi:MAG: hypothetical protein KDD62_08210, partial [Bdellovibrionales bacterium]|nr:hypothetical protein [Bdellovibrionales bacterium]
MGVKKVFTTLGVTVSVAAWLLSPTPLFAQNFPRFQLKADQSAIAKSYATHKGKKIREIRIILRDIFEGDEDYGIYHTANRLKMSTRESVIRQELLFEEGQEFDPFLLEESIRNLRSLKYLRHIKIKAEPVGEEVDIVVDLQDTWTLIPQAGYSSGDGRSKFAAGLSESDLLGYGKRLEVLYRQDDENDSIEAVWDDRRVMGSDYETLVGLFDRDDGERVVGLFGRPFRTLVDKNAWQISTDYFDTIGRLYENNEERYIFRQDNLDLAFSYAITRGDPSKDIRRYSFGLGYSDITFSQANKQDFNTIGIEPGSITNDPALLADARRYIGPLFSYSTIEPEFISLNYIDRFERVEDFNLGAEFSFSTQLAPEVFGSEENALLYLVSRSGGLRLSDTSFVRAEINTAGRYEDEFQNSLSRFEAKYYNVLGEKKVLGVSLGKHTVAVNFLTDYGYDFDRDRELLVGGDNALRGYEARTFTGDKRVVLNLEDRVHLFENVLQLLDIGGAVFAEFGGSTTESYGELFSDHMYGDVGVGLRLGFPRSSGSRILRFDLAFPLRDGPEGSQAFEPRFLVS